MRKQDLVDLVANTADISNRDADKAVAALFEHVTNALARGDSVNLIGFGSFVVKQRSARTGRNPKTGEPLQIAASQNVHFKSGKHLKEEINRDG
jgi:DNA-binding protein HU-beta